MPALTLPNLWGEEGFNVVREAIIEYCALARTPTDLAYGFQWDSSVMLIDDRDDRLPRDVYDNCVVAVNIISHYLLQGSDPWEAVKQAREEWEKDFADKAATEQRPMDDPRN